MIKVRSHITVAQLYHRQAPTRHIMLNELADAAAFKATDHQDYWPAEHVRANANVELLWQVCRRISYIEKTIQGTSEGPPIVVVDIINSV